MKTAESCETTKSASSLLMNHIHYEASSFTYSLAFPFTQHPPPHPSLLPRSLAQSHPTSRRKTRGKVFLRFISFFISFDDININYFITRKKGTIARSDFLQIFRQQKKTRKKFISFVNLISAFSSSCAIVYCSLFHSIWRWIYPAALLAFPLDFSNYT